MNFKVNLIIILVVLNLLFIFVLISKKEKFNNNRAVLIDPSLKNKVKVETSVLLDNLKPVDKVSIKINKGEILGLVGESGSGKSLTALSILKLNISHSCIQGVSNFHIIYSIK